MRQDGSSKQRARLSADREQTSEEAASSERIEQAGNGGGSLAARRILLPPSPGSGYRDPIALPDELIPAYRAKLHERVKLIAHAGWRADLKPPEELLSRLPSTYRQSVESRLNLLHQGLVSGFDWAGAFAGLPVRLEYFAFSPTPHLAEVHSNEDPSEYLRAVSTYGLLDPLPRIETGVLPVAYDLNDVFRRSQLLDSEIYREHYREGSGPTGWTRIELVRTTHGVWTLAFTHALATREGRVYRRTLLARLAASFQRLTPWLVGGERRGGTYFDLTHAHFARMINSGIEGQSHQETESDFLPPPYPLRLRKNSSYIIDDAVETGELQAECMAEPEKREFEELARRQDELMKELRENSRKILALSPYRIFHNTTISTKSLTAALVRTGEAKFPILLTHRGERVRAVISPMTSDEIPPSQAKPLKVLTDDLHNVCQSLVDGPILLRKGGSATGTVLAQLTPPSRAAKATADARRLNTVLNDE